MDRWSRRRVVQGACGLGLAAVTGCGRLPWQAEPPARIPRIGWLNTNNAPYDASFRQGLLEQGYVEGRNVIVEWRRTETDEGVRAAVAELAQLNVDVLVTAGGATALRDVTSTTPIVIALGDDPVAVGLVPSLARPGGNITGLNNMGTLLNAKRLELLKEAAPGISHVGVIWQQDYVPGMRSWEELPGAAQALGVELRSLAVREPGDLEGVLEKVKQEQMDALLVIGGPFTSRNSALLADVAVRSQVPAISTARGIVVNGALMAYGADLNALVRRSAVYVDKILKGARPGDLPIEQPREFEFIINLKTARALGLTIPQHVLLQATEVIQ